MIDGNFMYSYSAFLGDQSGGKNVKHGQSVAQFWQQLLVICHLPAIWIELSY
jgi:hypothetical protein